MSEDPRRGFFAAALQQLGNIFCCGKCGTSPTNHSLIEDRNEQLLGTDQHDVEVAPITQAPQLQIARDESLMEIEENNPSTFVNKKTAIQTQGKSVRKDVEWFGGLHSRKIEYPDEDHVKKTAASERQLQAEVDAALITQLPQLHIAHVETIFRELEENKPRTSSTFFNKQNSKETLHEVHEEGFKKKRMLLQGQLKLGAVQQGRLVMKDVESGEELRPKKLEKNDEEFVKKKVAPQTHEVDTFIGKKTSSIRSPLRERREINGEVNVTPINQDAVKKDWASVVLPRKPETDENYSLSAISFHYIEKAQHHLEERHRLFKLAQKYKTLNNKISSYKYFELAKKELENCQHTVSLLKNGDHINDFNMVIIKSYHAMLDNFLKDETSILYENDKFLKDLAQETQQQDNSSTEFSLKKIKPVEDVKDNEGFTNDWQEVLRKGQTDYSLATRHREKAKIHLKQKRRLLALAKKHSKVNNTRDAAHYFQEAKKHSKLSEEANNLAVAAILKQNKIQHPESNTIDLHCLFVKEAIPVLDSFLDDEIRILRNRSLQKVSLTVITGWGKHSVDRIPKIKPAVIERLSERSLEYFELNPGSLNVDIVKSSLLSMELHRVLYC